jgi:flagellar basal-body rod protein FlgB
MKFACHVGSGLFWRWNMPVSLNDAFGLHATALRLRSQRGEVLASNLANADTPNYKAQDLDFKAALNHAQDQHVVRLAATQAGHIRSHVEAGNAYTLYRIPNQSSLDGNTVDTQVEQSKFAENAVRYRASLQFLTGKINSLMTAIKGD